MKICVLGAGALGCAIGGKLAAAGHELWLINHRQAQVDALNRHGLIMRVADQDIVQHVRAATSCEGIDRSSGTVDLIIVLVKSFDTEAAMASATSIIGPDTVVLSLQNGMGHEEIVSRYVAQDRLLAGKTYVGGVMLAPGHIIAGTAGKLTLIGELQGALSPRLMQWVACFNQAGLLTEASTNIRGVIWDKLLVNVATGALSGITQLTYGELYNIDCIEQGAIAAAAEAMAVAHAEGITLSITEPREAWVRASAGLPKNFKASMLQSLQKGSKTEIDYINGAVIRAARRHGIATPVNQTLVACIKGIERALELGSVTTAPNAASLETGASSYLEHVALRVADIQWHLRFFKEVLGQDLREVDGPADRPRQVWTLGGLQFMDTPNFKPKPSNDEGWLAHLGIMVNDLDKALRDAHQWDVSVLPQGPNWLQLPDGLAVELIQAAPGAVKAALSVQPR